MRLLSAAVSISMGCAALSTPAHAQFGRGNSDWSTAGFDAQRSYWVRTDPKISKESMAKPGFAMTWKIGLKDKAAGDLGPPIVMGRYIGYRGFRSFAFLGGAGDNVYTVDTDLSRLEWHDHLAPAAALPPGCTASSVPSVVRPSSAAIAAAPQGRGGGGRGGPAHAAVGQPGEGAVTLEQLAAAARMAAGRAGRGEAGRGRGGFDPSMRRIQNSLLILTSDGMLHSVWLSSGEKSEEPIKFLPPGAAGRGLILIDSVVYAASPGGCGTPSGVSALNLTTKEVTNWSPKGGMVAGEAGPAIGPDETVYVASNGSSAGVAALAAKTLDQKDWYASEGVDMVSSPVIFEYKDRTLMAVAAKNKKIVLLDTKSLGGADHRTPLLSASVDAAPESLSSWQDTAGTRWLLGAADGAIRAWKVVEGSAGPSIESGWTSRDIASPIAPIVVNGVVFTASKGSRSSPGVLYALDSATGKELWNSGRIMASAVAESGLSAGDTQVYVGTADGTLYAFGFPIEH